MRMNSKFCSLVFPMLPLLLLFLATTTTNVVVVQASPTCYEYYDALCETEVQETYHALTGANCSHSDFDANALGTACLTTNLVALTKVEANSCRKTFGSVQLVSQCVPYGQRGGRNLWMYCTAAGCDDFGETCTANQVTRPGLIHVWDECGNGDDDDVPDYYPDPLPTDGQCYALPDKGASVRLTCLNNLYMQAEIYHDLACEQLSPLNSAPTFLMSGYDECYPFQGATGGFALRVDQGCKCGPEQTLAPTLDAYGDDILRFDLMYNMTVNGSNCIEGTGLIDFEGSMEQETNRDMTADISNAALVTTHGKRWWFLSMALRFEAIPQPLIIDFQAQVDAIIDNGRVLEIIKATCGYDMGQEVTLNNTGGTIVDRPWTRAPVTSAATARMTTYRNGAGWWMTAVDRWWIGSFVAWGTAVAFL